MRPYNHLVVDQQIKLKIFSHGGLRPGAGRPNVKGEGAHERRPDVGNDTPARVTLKMRESLPSLRNQELLNSFQEAADASKEFGLRVLAFSMLKDRVELVVEAYDNLTLTKGMKSLSIRFAKAMNKYIRRHRFPRKGSVYQGRYKLDLLQTREAVLKAYSEVLLAPIKNYKKGYYFDAFSSGLFFQHWEEVLGRGWQNKFKKPSTTEMESQKAVASKVLSKPRFELSL